MEVFIFNDQKSPQEKLKGGWGLREGMNLRSVNMCYGEVLGRPFRGPWGCGGEEISADIWKCSLEEGMIC